MTEQWMWSWCCKTFPCTSTIRSAKLRIQAFTCKRFVLFDKAYSWGQLGHILLLIKLKVNCYLYTLQNAKTHFSLLLLKTLRAFVYLTVSTHTEVGTKKQNFLHVRIGWAREKENALEWIDRLQLRPHYEIKHRLASDQWIWTDHRRKWAPEYSADWKEGQGRILLSFSSFLSFFFICLVCVCVCDIKWENYRNLRQVLFKPSFFCMFHMK